MGKTSLVREFRERLPGGTAFRLGRCLSYGRSVTYSALADVLRQDSACARRTWRGAARRPRDPRPYARPRRRRRSRAAGGASALQDQWVAHLAARRARTSGAVIEDLHWAAEPLIEVLDACSRTRARSSCSLPRGRAGRSFLSGRDVEPGTPRRRGGDRARRGRRSRPHSRARSSWSPATRRETRSSSRKCSRTSSKGAARAEEWRLVAGDAAGLSASRTPFRASSPPASTCYRPRRRRRSRLPR